MAEFVCQKTPKNHVSEDSEFEQILVLFLMN